MATHSSVLAWRIPGTGEPGGLPSMGSHRVGHDLSDLAVAASLIYSDFQDNHQPPPGFLTISASAVSVQMTSWPGLPRSTPWHGTVFLPEGGVSLPNLQKGQ